MSRLLRTACVLAVAAAAAAIGAMSVSASGRAAEAQACTLLSQPQLRSTLGLGQSQTYRNYDPTVAISEAVHTECGWVVWSGPPPTSVAGAFALAMSGHGAQVGIETWAPHQGPNLQQWLDTDYDTLTGRLLKGLVTLPGFFSTKGLVAKKVAVPSFGHDHVAVQVNVPGKPGLIAAVACWMDDKSSSAICMLDEEAAFRPAAAHLIAFAKSAVPKFL